MLTYEVALKRVLAHTPSPRAAHVALDAALELVLAEPVVSPMDLPCFDNSAVDGYAVRTQDFGALGSCAEFAPWMLRVVGRAHAGAPFRGLVHRGEAVRILTGAAVPQGANTVIMQEQAVRKNDWLFIEHPPRAGQHIRRRGEDLRRGTRVLSPGTRLRPQELGLLAALGYATVRVYRRPTVAILTTGDELCRPGSRLKPGCIYESNGTLVQALVQRSGGLAKRLGLVRDTEPALRAAVQQGLAADILVMTGGVSVGDKDVVRHVARRCGIRQLFWQVDIKPGMPLFVGRCRRTLVFGLPGNPVSVFVTFEEFVKPALQGLMGRAWKDSYTIPATLAADLCVSATRRTQFIRVSCTGDNGSTRVAPLEGQGSHHLRSLVEADGWIRVLSDGRVQPAGTAVSLKRGEFQ